VVHVIRIYEAMETFERTPALTASAVDRATVAARWRMGYKKRINRQEWVSDAWATKAFGM
jgi:hypothetical protein